MDEKFLFEKSKDYLIDNKKFFTDFAYNVFINEGPKNENLVLTFETKISTYGYFRFPNIVNVNIHRIIYDYLHFTKPNYNNYKKLDQIIKAKIIEVIIHEKFHSIQYHPRKFAGMSSYTEDKKSKVHKYYEYPVYNIVYKYIMNNLDYLSHTYNVDKEILSNVQIMYNYRYFLMNKKFKRCSMYNNLVRILDKFDIPLPDNFEHDVLGEKYYRSSVYAIINEDSFIIKDKSSWNFENMQILFIKLKRKQVHNVSFEIKYN